MRGPSFAAAISVIGFALTALDAGDARAVNLAPRAREPRFPWALIDDKHWQIVHSPRESQAETDAREQNRGTCAEGMVEIQGDMKLDPQPNAWFGSNTVEELQKKTCTKWLNREYPERCTSFDRDAWLRLSASLPTKPMHFCMDRYEYPNQRGAYPIVLVNYGEAAGMCAAEGKRLCDEEEWTFACEGEEATPYPYGYGRDAEACVIDRSWKAFRESALLPRGNEEAGAELDRLWQGMPSGESPQCRSTFGVYDLTGNVDEWTKSVRPRERPSILKGGYWGPVRTRCRPSTRSHNEFHTFYQQGVRCCADAPEPNASTWHASVGDMSK